MNYKIIIIILFLLSSCTNNIVIQNNENQIIKPKFVNSGFTLIYNEKLFTNKIINKKMNDRDLIIFQKNLKKGASVKLINPINNKSLLAYVGKKTIYPSFNNSVVSKRIAFELELNNDEPYIIIEEIVDNSAFFAKKAKTYEEEKEVANKAPVEKILVNDLNKTLKKINIKKVKKFNYSIKIADFYFEDSAKTMKKKILNESTIKNVDIIEKTKNKYRVIIGPYMNLKSLQKDYNKLEKLNFENIQIIKNV